jgi:aryl-alcohol dehydrogenase
MNSLKVPKGASVAVFGAGSVGLAAVMAARIVGADPIIDVDENPGRLELALELGATFTNDLIHRIMMLERALWQR